jgi:hypothetical protein
MKRIRFNHHVAGEIAESDLVIYKPEEWEDTPEKATGEWSAGIVDLTDELDESIPAEVPQLWFALGPARS